MQTYELMGATILTQITTVFHAFPLLFSTHWKQGTHSILFWPEETEALRDELELELKLWCLAQVSRLHGPGSPEWYWKTTGRCSPQGNGIPRDILDRMQLELSWFNFE